MGSICSQLIFLIDPGEWFNLFRSNQSFDHKKTNNSINKSIIKFPTLLIFFKDRREQLDEGQPFLKIGKIKRSKIKSSKDPIPNPARMYSLWLCTCSVHVYPGKYLWQCPFIRSNLPTIMLGRNYSYLCQVGGQIFSLITSLHHWVSMGSLGLIFTWQRR